MSLFTKILLSILGSIFVLIGIAGIFLPLLPATPFLLLASACYVRSSDRLYNWLMNNNHLGAYIRNFREQRGMPVRAKIITLMIFWLSIAISIYRLDPLSLRLLLLFIAVGVTLLILRIKTLKPLE